MKKNVGKTDRIIRLIVGIAILAGGYSFQSWWGLVGIVALATAVLGFCPLYLPFKINTN